MLRFSFYFEKITNNILSGFRFNLKRKEKTLDRDTFLISKGRNEKKKTQFAHEERSGEKSSIKPEH